MSVCRHELPNPRQFQHACVRLVLKLPNQSKTREAISIKFSPRQKICCCDVWNLFQCRMHNFEKMQFNICSLLLRLAAPRQPKLIFDDGIFAEFQNIKI